MHGVQWWVSVVQMCNTSSPDCLCPRRLNLPTEVPGQQPALTSGLGDPAEPWADPAPLGCNLELQLSREAAVFTVKQHSTKKPVELLTV